MSGEQGRIPLFHSLFRGREDVHAERFTTRNGRSGYGPVCRRKFKKEEGCRIGTISRPCDGCPTADYLPLTENALRAHLAGQTVRGIYLLLPDNTCWAFAGDFDAPKDDPEGPRKAWDEARRFWEVCDTQELPAYIERSQSGKGFHPWMFFDAPIPAWKIRLLAQEGLLPEAGLELGSGAADRFFPNQDKHSGKGLGNLIALPLQGKLVSEGRTAFLDPKTGEPVPDQWEFLQAIERVSEPQIDELLDLWGISREKPQNGRPATRITIPYSGPPADAEQMAERCAFMRHFREDAEHLPEPHWWAGLSNVIRCEGGREIAHRWSAPYPQYSAEETDAKVSRGLEASGPHTCAYIRDQLGFAECQTCPEKVTAPILLGRPEAAGKPPERSERSDGTYSSTGPSERKITLVPRPAVDLIKQAPAVTWQVEKILPEGASGVFVSDSGVGKTWLTLALALDVDRGEPWLGQFVVRPGKVLIIDEENADPLIKHRLQKLLRAHRLPEDGSTVGIEFLTSEGINLSDSAYVEALERVLEEKRPDLVIVDALVRVHQGNENDAGDMARIFGIVKGWMGEYGCSFVFCHHRKKPGMVGSDPASMYRGSSEIRAFVDVHLDLRAIRGEKGVFTVEHSKARYAEPVPAFNVEIVDVAEDATMVRYAGEPKTQTQEKLADAQEFILSLAADREWHSRKEILEKGVEQGHKRDTLDAARKLLLEAGDVLEEKCGKSTGIRLSERSDGPVHYIVPSETNEPSSLAEMPVEEGVV